MKLDEIKFSVAMVKAEMRMNDLVKASGISRNTLSAAKGGKRIKPETAAAIAKALGIEVTDILED